MTVEDALAFFAGSPEVVRSLAPLAAVGLGYCGSASRCRRSRAARHSG